jgi:hypothetical protein
MHIGLSYFGRWRFAHIERKLQELRALGVGLRGLAYTKTELLFYIKSAFAPA